MNSNSLCIYLYYSFSMYYFNIKKNIIFLICPHKGGMGIQTSDLRFMRCGPQSIELPLEDKKKKKKKKVYLIDIRKRKKMGNREKE
jgi:hypothetical protein